MGHKAGHPVGHCGGGGVAAPVYNRAYISVAGGEIPVARNLLYAVVSAYELRKLGDAVCIRLDFFIALCAGVAAHYPCAAGIGVKHADGDGYLVFGLPRGCKHRHGYNACKQKQRQQYNQYFFSHVFFHSALLLWDILFCELYIGHL